MVIGVENPLSPFSRGSSAMCLTSPFAQAFSKSLITPLFAQAFSKSLITPLEKGAEGIF